MSFERLQRIDSRWLWLVFLLCVIIPIIRPMGLPVNVSDGTRLVYDTINNIPEGGIVFLAPDYAFENRGEMQPMMEAILRQLFSMNVKVISASFYQAPSPLMLEDAVNVVGLEAHGKIYGVDYVNLGFYPGREPSVVAFGTDTWKFITVDQYGTPISDLPIMEHMSSAEDIDLVISLSAGGQFPEVYLRQWQTRWGTKVTGGSVAMIYPMLLGYVASDQLTGLLASSRGAAEYELVIGKPGEAIGAMDSQSLGHIITIVFIVFCNIGQVKSLMNPRKEEA